MFGAKSFLWERLYESSKILVAGKPVNMFSMNQYLVGCKVTQEACLIDCGDERIEDWIQYALKSCGDHSFQISKILQTHCHIDHMAGLKRSMDMLAQESYNKEKGVSLYLHQGDVAWVKDPFQGLTGSSFIFRNFQEPDLPQVFLKDQEVIKVGELEFHVIHCPGHSPGHCVFYCKSEGVAFTGDLIFAGSIGRTDLPHCNHQDMQQSLKKVKDLLPNKVKLFSGHGKGTTMEAEKKHNPFLFEAHY